MYLEKISLLNFKNYGELNLDFSDSINCITGKNGSGKTNLLDAIYYLSMSRSAFNPSDQQNILHGQSFFMIKGTFHLEEQHEVLCSFQKGKKKTLKTDNLPYDKISEHIGRFPVVMIAPNDNDLIREGSEIRRKYFDSVIAQIHPEYLDLLYQYNYALKQRNSVLKDFWERNYRDNDLIEPYSRQLLETGKSIHHYRKNFAGEILPRFLEHFQNLTDSQEEASFSYHSDVAGENFEQRFYETFEKDVVLQRTTTGAHKDDYEFKIKDYPLKKFGSQGQQKSFLVALKLTQFDIVNQYTGKRPILLLDDIFDKLDEKRIFKLIKMVSQDIFGQIFITDASRERAEHILRQVREEKPEIKDSMTIYTVENGEVTS